MRAGTMRERVAIQERSRVSDGQGGFTESWANVSTYPNVFAHVAPLSGTERVAAMQIDTRATHRVTVRYRSDLDTSQRLVWENRYLYPVGPWLNMDERGVTLTATCREDKE